jgi:hypothetical protein
MSEFTSAALYHLSALERIDTSGLDERSSQCFKHSLRSIRKALEDAKKQEPQPGVANLDAFTGVTFSNQPNGGWIGDVEMVKWLVLNRDKDYWENKND